MGLEPALHILSKRTGEIVPSISFLCLCMCRLQQLSIECEFMSSKSYMLAGSPSLRMCSISNLPSSGN